jgi:hypothetical protein
MLSVLVLDRAAPSYSSLLAISVWGAAACPRPAACPCMQRLNINRGRIIKLPTSNPATISSCCERSSKPPSDVTCSNATTRESVKGDRRSAGSTVDSLAITVNSAQAPSIGKRQFCARIRNKNVELSACPWFGHPVPQQSPDTMRAGKRLHQDDRVVTTAFNRQVTQRICLFWRSATGQSRRSPCRPMSASLRFPDDSPMGAMGQKQSYETMSPAKI